MKWSFIWIAVFSVSWSIGAIVCGVAYWRKNYQFAKNAALAFFCWPAVLLLANYLRQHFLVSDFEYAKTEVTRLCALDGGDKIYKTVDNVQGVFQMRARKDERQKGLRDQYGMVDPYGYAQGDRNKITQLLAGTGINSASNSSLFGRYGYWFLEQFDGNSLVENQSYIRTYLFDTGNKHEHGYFAIQSGDPIYEHKNVHNVRLKSHYGYLTEDITTKDMRDKWIGAGLIKIIDLQTNEVLAERKGYFSADGNMLGGDADRWGGGGYGMCPYPPNNSGLIGFLHSVLKPVQGFPTNEQLQEIAKD
jgi:hypothetical protein